jgi:hypothetical protein
MITEDELFQARKKETIESQCAQTSLAIEQPSVDTTDF